MVNCGEPGCPEVFTNGRQRRRHVHTVHRALPYICAECNNEPFLFEDALRQHINCGHMKWNRHRNRPITVPPVVSASSVKPVAAKVFECTEAGCSVVFAKRRQRRRHVHDVHRHIPKTCAESDDTPFENENDIKHPINEIHVNVDRSITVTPVLGSSSVRQKSIFECTEPGCSEMFAKHRQRRHHIHDVHRRLPYICTECDDEPFMTESGLKQHIKGLHMTANGNRKLKSKKKNEISNSALSINALSQSSSTCLGNLSDSLASLRLGPTDNSTPTTVPPVLSSSTGHPCRHLFDAQSSGDLDTLIADKIQPDSDFLSSCGNVVDELVNFLQHNAPGSVRPTQVFKGGSLCKGTAVNGKSDVDLEVSIRGYDSVADLRGDMETILDDLETSLDSYPSITVTGRTRHGLEVELRKMGYTIEADILPIVDLSLGTQRSRDQVFDKMENESSVLRRFYSPCLSPLQKKLFEGVPTQVKSLIRLVKYWKKEKLQGEDARGIKWPASYALELVILDRWAKAGSPQSFDMTRALHSVLTSLVNHKQYAIKLPEKRLYSEDYFIWSMPYIIDPCNPFNDVYSMAGYDWDSTATKASVWLSKPLFNGCHSTTNSW